MLTATTKPESITRTLNDEAATPTLLNPEDNIAGARAQKVLRYQFELTDDSNNIAAEGQENGVTTSQSGLLELTTPTPPAVSFDVLSPRRENALSLSGTIAGDRVGLEVVWTLSGTAVGFADDAALTVTLDDGSSEPLNIITFEETRTVASI